MSPPSVEGDIYTETLGVFADDGEPLTTPEVATALEMNRRAVYERLSTLADSGELQTKKVGSGGRVWWRPAGDDQPTPATETERTRHERLIDAIGDPVCAVDEDGRVTHVNDRFAEQFGYDMDESLGMHVSEFMDPDELRAADERVRSLAAEGATACTKLEFDIFTSDDERVPVETHLVVEGTEDGTFQGAIGVIRDSRQRTHSEKQLERQQVRLAALNNLHTVVREITEAVLERSTRGEIERTVCEQLAGSASYTAALIVEIDPEHAELTPRVEVGFSGYAETIDASIDPTDPAGQGPAGRAARTRTAQVSRDVFSDPTFEPWRDEARDFGFRSCAVIPILHEATMYGMICIYTERPDAFADDELQVITQLGEIVGHAIAAAERKRAMMSDEVVEIGYRGRRFLEMLGIEAASGVVELKRVVPVGDGSYLLYGTVRDGGLDALERLVETDSADHYESCTVLSAGGSRTHVEVKVSESPIASAVSAFGGYIDEARLADGDLFVQVHLPPGTDINRLTDDIQERYPRMEPVTRRQKTRQKRTSEQFTTVLESELTERQLAALEAGYFSGFFEWPRDSSGKEVAASLDISPATFHQHVRTAERKILDELFAET